MNVILINSQNTSNTFWHRVKSDDKYGDRAFVGDQASKYKTFTDQILKEIKSRKRKKT